MTPSLLTPAFHWLEGTRTHLIPVQGDSFLALSLSRSWKRSGPGASSCGWPTGLNVPAQGPGSSASPDNQHSCCRVSGWGGGGGVVKWEGRLCAAPPLCRYLAKGRGLLG